MIKYNAPELEVITFTAEDIITASGVQAPAVNPGQGGGNAGGGNQLGVVGQKYNFDQPYTHYGMNFGAYIEKDGVPGFDVRYDTLTDQIR